MKGKLEYEKIITMDPFNNHLIFENKLINTTSKFHP